MTRRRFFISSGAGWDGERSQSAALLINTQEFFPSAPLRWLEVQQNKETCRLPVSRSSPGCADPVMVSVTVGSQHHHQPPSWPTLFCCFVLFFFSQGKQQNFNDSLAKRRYTQRSRRAAAAACDVACVEKCCLV